MNEATVLPRFTFRVTFQFVAQICEFCLAFAINFTGVCSDSRTQIVKRIVRRGRKAARELTSWTGLAQAGATMFA